MKKQSKSKSARMPTSFILIVIWMFIAIFSLISKLFNFSRFRLNQQILGKGLAIFDYFMDALIFVGFIVFIIMFFRKTKNTWKYFIWFMGVLALGEIVGLILGFVNLDKFIELIGSTGLGISNGFFAISMIISFIFNLVIYGLIIYYTNKNKQWFKK